MWLLAALVFACTPTGTLDYDPSDDRGIDGDDTGSSGDDTGSTGDDTGGGDTDEEIGPSYPRTWTGGRFISFDNADCEGELFEEGIEITEEPWASDILESCGGCDQIYELNVSPDAICNDQVGIADLVYRGLAWSGPEVTVFSITEDRGWDADELASGEDEGDKVVYGYRGDYYGYDYRIEGWFILE